MRRLVVVGVLAAVLCGAARADDVIAGGAKRTLQAPGEGDWVLHIVRQ